MAPQPAAAAAESMSEKTERIEQVEQVELIEIATAFGDRVPALRATVAGGELIELLFALAPAAVEPSAQPGPAGPVVDGRRAAAATRLPATDARLPAAATRLPVTDARQPAEAPPLAEVRRQLAEYFAGRRRDFDLPLAPRGTAFERQVWEALLAIPYGETRSYAEIARSIGHPDACRAVGRANGRNPIPIVIPCHRVIGSDGSLTGYGGGLDLKRLLLGLEGAAWSGAAAGRAAPQLALPL